MTATPIVGDHRAPRLAASPR